jgi:ElaB/YqjD/DUF883 family membrane-anchored ribosome-binding protein
MFRQLAQNPSVRYRGFHFGSLVSANLRHFRPHASVQRAGARRNLRYLTHRPREEPLEAPRKFQQLIADVEELLAGLDDEHSPQLERLRERVETTMSQAKSALTKRGKSTTAQVRHYAGVADDYITGYPRAAFASGILIGAVLGFLVASTRSSD